MAKTTNINIRTEPDVKQRIENLFSQFGITVSDAVNIFFHQSLMQGGLPFQMQIPEYNAETLAAIDDVDNNRNMSPAFDSMDDLMRSLYA
ncbi:MAG: type II toxin-antitoxin system RelB/DinJ family antitoxin [Oscillospiraceae bacterium]|nr:type II toxin-antitoxin system RelB/DinJ family antitoxin [Oscillospiraceae bacterium]